MNDKKNIFEHLGEWQRTRQEKQQTTPRPASRWLPSPGNVIFTLVMVGLLILTQRTWASNSQSANTPGPSATTINYQGRLADDTGNPETGTLGISFAIWDAANGGGIIWGPESHSAVPVTDGLFNVGLGSQTSGGIPTTVWNGDRYLEITVSGETLTPRELIRSVPIAGMALTVPDGTIGKEKLSMDVSNIVLFDSRIGIIYESPAITDDDQWHDLDISAHVPTDAEAVILAIGNRGSTLELHGGNYLSVHGFTGNWGYNQGFSPIIDGKIKYKAHPYTDAFIIGLVGYVH